jgi:hypothetical protein
VLSAESDGINLSFTVTFGTPPQAAGCGAQTGFTVDELNYGLFIQNLTSPGDSVADSVETTLHGAMPPSGSLLIERPDGQTESASVVLVPRGLKQKWIGAAVSPTNTIVNDQCSYDYDGQDGIDP